MTNNFYQFHYPVMLNEVLHHLAPQDNQFFVDATFGAGGYSTAILNAAKCNLLAIDRDQSVQQFATSLQQNFKERFKIEFDKFSNLEQILQQNQITEIDGIVFDIGVSSMQLNNAERGFSFDSNARLNMRMNQQDSVDAFEVVNNFSQEQLKNIIRNFGDEPKSGLIAKKIVNSRKIKPIVTCLELANIVRSCYFGNSIRDAATKTFQAIRIFVKQELQELELALNSALKFLKKNGKIVVVSFHSLEDRIVKNFFREKAGKNISFSRYEPVLLNENNFQLKIITNSPLIPSSSEVASNFRSRCAKMRVAVKI